jgi:hypothetical protein
MGGKTTRRTRIAALDKVFSEYVRRRASDGDGMVRCITCQVQMKWQDAHAGHFWKRSHMGTRWDLRNVHPQCPRDNLHRNGAEAEHAAYILDTYGQHAFNELVYRKNQITKLGKREIEDLIAEYREKLEALG